MRLFFKSKDGGEHSNCTGWWLVESKRFFSVALLKFDGPSRDAFHSHAFNSINWLLKGALEEIHLDKNPEIEYYKPSIKPIIVSRNTFHKVNGNTLGWVISLRGPWVVNWYEVVQNKLVTLTKGRKVVRSEDY